MKRTVLSSCLVLIGALALPAQTATVCEEKVFTSNLSISTVQDTASTGVTTISTLFKDAIFEKYRLNYFNPSKGTLLNVQLFASGRIINAHTAGGSCLRGVVTPCNATISNDRVLEFGIDVEPVNDGSIGGPPDIPGSPLRLPGQLKRGFANDSNFSFTGALFDGREGPNEIRDTRFNVSRTLTNVGIGNRLDNFTGTGTFDVTVWLGVDGTTEVDCSGLLAIAIVCNAQTLFNTSNDMTITLRYTYDDTPPTLAPNVQSLRADLPLMFAGLGGLAHMRRRKG